MLLLRDGTEVSTPELIGLGPTRHAIFLCQQSGATGGQAWKGPGYGRGYGAWHSPSSTDIEAKHSTKTVWVKSGQGFVGQRLTGNRGSFFPLFGTSGKGGWADWNQRTTEKGQEPTSKKVIPTTHIPLENGQCIFPFFPFPHQLHDVGARGAKELGGLCPGNNSRDEAKHTCHPPTPGRLHHLTHTHTHNDTQTCTIRRLVCSSDRQEHLRFPARLGILLLPSPSPPPFLGFSACFMYKVCWIFLFLFLACLSLSLSCSGNVFFPL